MPRQKKRTLSPSNAARFIDFLIAEGKIITRDIERFFEIDRLEDRLRALRGSAGVQKGIRAPKAGDRPVNKRKRAISSKGRASHQLQGRYIAYIRQFPKNARAKYQRIAKKQGREKAVAQMKVALAK